MTIGYPVWYQGGFGDVERIMRDLFASLLTNVDVVAWMPPDYATVLATGNAFLRIFRMGGHIERNTRNWVDEAKVQFAALSAQRDDSWALLTFVREVLEAYADGGHVVSQAKHVFIQTEGEVIGPQLIPEQMRDERLVVITYQIHVDRDRQLPYYRDALNLNNS